MIRKGKITTSFYDWCINNNRDDLLELWDYELNDLDTKNIGKESEGRFYFKCPKGLHESDLKLLCSMTRHNNYHFRCSVCESFGTWCEENNRRDLLERWDYDKNERSPYEVAASCNKKFFFKCERGLHDSESFPLNNLASEHVSGKCKKCNSFGQYLLDTFGKNGIKQYWSNQNTINPFEIGKTSGKKVYIICQQDINHPPYLIACSHFLGGKKCSYCSKHGLFVKEDSLGYLDPYSFDVWSDKNTKTPYDYTLWSNKKVWWKCECGKHDDYFRSIGNSSNYEFRCPECMSESKLSSLHLKIKKYLDECNMYIKQEHKCSLLPVNPKTKHTMPYDFEIVDYMLIVECQGKQHEEIMVDTCMFLKGLTPKEYLYKRQLYDRYKRFRAIQAGYEYLEIPYWTEKDESYKTLIDNKVSEIKAKQSSQQKSA